MGLARSSSTLAGNVEASWTSWVVKSKKERGKRFYASTGTLGVSLTGVWLHGEIKRRSKDPFFFVYHVMPLLGLNGVEGGRWRLGVCSGRHSQTSRFRRLRLLFLYMIPSLCFIRVFFMLGLGRVAMVCAGKKRIAFFLLLVFVWCCTPLSSFLVQAFGSALLSLFGVVWWWAWSLTEESEHTPSMA